MANANLDPHIGKATQFRSGYDAAIKGKKGGKNSGVVRREKKRAKELSAMLSSCYNKDVERIARDMGLEGKDECTNRLAQIAELHRLALYGESEGVRISAIDKILRLEGQYDEGNVNNGTQVAVQINFPTVDPKHFMR